MDQSLDELIFSCLDLPIDSNLKILMIEVLNLTDVTKLKMRRIGLIFKYMQDAEDFTKGQNELMYGNLLLLLGKFLCSFSSGPRLMDNVPREWVYELFSMFSKNCQRQVTHDSVEQQEKDILNCCFLHFICNVGHLIRTAETDMARIFAFARNILAAEISSNSGLSPLLDIEQSFIGDDIIHLKEFLRQSPPDSLQFFRILSCVTVRLAVPDLAQNHYQRKLMFTQSQLYESLFSHVRQLVLGELAPFPHSHRARDPSGSEGRLSSMVNFDELLEIVNFRFLGFLIGRLLEFYDTFKRGDLTRLRGGCPGAVSETEHVFGAAGNQR